MPTSPDMPSLRLVSVFNPARNSFGFLRLLFATTVILSHAWPLGGFGVDPGRPGNNLGILAVEGFFALSGFLITRSGESHGTGRFIWHRIVRIFPALWVCLVLIAAVFAPIVWHASHSMRDYLTTQPTAIGYVVNNMLLYNLQRGIGDTLAGNPFPNLWDGSLYTLSFEFSCYLLIAMLVAFKVLGRRSMTVLAILCWVWVQVASHGVLGAGMDTRQARFTLCFIVGSLIYLYRDEVLARSRWWVPAIAAVVAIGSYASVGFFQIGIIAYAYLCIWVGAVLPLHRIGVKRDYSYGMYIYGWPVLQLASFVGLNRLGMLVYLPVVLAVTVVLAAGSWHLIESRALHGKNARAPRWFTDNTMTAVPPRVPRRPPARR